MTRISNFYAFLLFVGFASLCLISFLPRAPSDRELSEYLQRIKSEYDHEGSSDEHKSHFKPDAEAMKLQRKKTSYPRRSNFSTCEKKFGKVTIFVAYVASSLKTHYRVAQESLTCYLKGTNYELLMVDLNTDKRVVEACSKNKQLFFLKHCAASVYLKDTDWMLVLDADTGIVNPEHCIEEWIDDRVNILFYERFFNFEIASGNYLVRNSTFSVDFLKKWSEWEFTQPLNWNGADNGVLQMHILQTVIPDAVQEQKNCDKIWHQSTGYDSYMAFVTCVKLALGATRMWPDKVRIYRRGHGWVRDGFISSDRFTDHDFMLHGWKAQTVGDNGWESPFNKNLDVDKCDASWAGWDYRNKSKKTTDELRNEIALFENSTAHGYPTKGRIIPYLELPDVGECWPNCDDLT